MGKYMELEEMKAQLALLNQKLEKETIVNERLMRRAMSDKVLRLNRQTRVITIVGLLSIPYCDYVFRHLIHASQTFTFVTLLFLLVCVGSNIYWQRTGLHAREMISGNLLEVSRKVIRMKQLYLKWLSRVGIPFLCVWIPWMLFEVSRMQGGVEYMTGMFCGCATGAILGGLLGYKYYRKTIRTYDELLNEIEELTENKNEDA